MSHYPLTWITESLAIGHAPMSYAEFDSIRDQGISGIVNLCGEFSDLHELEENAGFEVFYLPIPDETAPSMEEMEQALEWLDEVLYLGKKVLVHCKHGIGRTGTFTTAYMLRRGFNLKKASKLLKKTRANPTNFSQWWLLRKYGKQEGQLTIGEATAYNRTSQDLSEFFTKYENLLEKVDNLIQNGGSESTEEISFDHCKKRFSLQPIEALHLNNIINLNLTSDERNSVIEKGANIEKDEADAICPLRKKTGCALVKHRPVHCRIIGSPLTKEQQAEIDNDILQLSDNIFRTIFSNLGEGSWPLVQHTEAISGKFIQKYFHFLAAQKVDYES